MEYQSPHRSLVARVCFGLALIAGCGTAALGQGETGARPNRGTMPNGVYQVSDIENINLQDGNVNLSIPLAALPPIAGGKLSWALSAQYNSKVWNVIRSENNVDSVTWHPFDVDMPQVSDLGGWRVSGQYQISLRNAHEDYDYMTDMPVDSIPYSDYYLRASYNWFKAVLQMPDGSEHELRPMDYSPYSGGEDFLKGYYRDSPYSHSSMRYYSFDGSYIYAQINTNAMSWTVYLPDGTKIIQATDGIQRIQDTNGNKIKIFGDTNGTHYQDEQTGREIRYTYSSTGNNGDPQGVVHYQTVTGVSEEILINFGYTNVQGQVYKVTDWIEGHPHSCQHFNELNAQLLVIREIVLPETEPSVVRKFSFTYNSDATESATTSLNWICDTSGQDYTRTASKGWGALNNVTTPSGAQIHYSYLQDTSHYPFPSFFANDIAKESITQKQIIHDGVTDTWGYGIWNYDYGGTGTVTNPDGSSMSQTRYGHKNAFGWAYGKAGLTYRIEQPFKRVEKHWVDLVFTSANLDSPGGPVSFNPVVDAEYTTLLDAGGNALKMSATTYQFDYNGNVTQTREYDWFDPASVSRDSEGVPTGVPGSATLLRTVNNTYYNPATTNTSGNVYAKRDLTYGTPLILNALQQTTLGSSTVQLSYDSQAYGTAPTVGNLTSKSVWDDVDNKWTTTSQTYGAYGNVVSATDARGKVTQFFYDDATHALPNRVVVDPQNGTGTQTVTTAFDYYTGLVTSQKDANDNIATVYYTNQLLGTVDPFGRPGVTIGPLININGTDQHHRVTTTYEDHLLRLTVAADLNAENDKLLKSRTTSDMLGRAILSEQSEDGTNYTIYSRKAYDQMGKITYASSPMRYNTSASTDAWTRVTNDNAGRVTEVATFGSATQPSATGTSGIWTGSVTTSYDANTVTVIDQAGKQRKSVSDALGRLVQLYEAPNDSNYNYQTSYDYDVFGNLRHVYQGTQTRTFTYDSLSRLRTAANPESGTITYSYDDNGNLTQKTDARSITSTYVYDALNRATSRTYSDSTPAVTYTYDAGSGVSNPRGRLISVSSSVSSYSYSGYDAMGRVGGGAQTLGSQTYSLSYTYTLAGSVKSMTYPSGRVVSNNYDSAGRLNSFTGNLGDGATRTYATGVSYDAGSRMTQEQFGTDTAVYNKLFYNSRGQLSEIRESTVGNDTSWNRGAIINHYSDQCWGMCSGHSMTDNNGNLKHQDNYIPDNEHTFTDWYTYDSLNRLQTVTETNYVSSTNQTTTPFQQSYSYDRFGNRSINTQNNATYGPVNSMQAAVVQNTTTNRMYAPGETEQNHPLIDYDNAGNQKKDYYSDPYGVHYDRIYDAENRMTQSTATYSSPPSTQVSTYSYDGDGHRVKRNLVGTETWQVYGLGGELLAEYAANATSANPQKEYGYRNGQLLVTAEPGSSTGGSSSGLVGFWKFDENSGTAAADSSGTGNTGTLASGASWGTGQTNSAVNLDGVDDYVQVGAQSGLVMTSATSFSAWIYPTGAGSDATYGGVILSKEGEYLMARFPDGTIQWAFANSNPGWAFINTGYVAPLNQWTHVAITYDSGVIKTYINGTVVHTYNGSGSIGDYNTSQNDFRVGGRQGMSENFQGRIDEVRVYNRPLTAGEVSTLAGPPTSGLKGYWKFDENTGTTAADSSGSGNTGTLTSGASWGAGQTNSAVNLDGVDDYVQVGAQSGLVMTSAASFSAWIYPTGAGSDATYGGTILSKEGEYLIVRFADGTIRWAFANSNPGWAFVNTGYTAPLNQWTQVTITYDAGVVKTYINGTLTHTNSGSGAIGDANTSQNDFRVGGRQNISENFQGRIDDVRVYNRALTGSEVTTLTSSGGAEIEWLVTDQLGTPRMIFDKTGSLANTKRHDYLPFGEELFANQGLRTTAQGYPQSPNSNDTVRQKFTQKERDNETGLDYFGARYYASMQGRFTGTDVAGPEFTNPQTLNKYQYCLNNPLTHFDRNGLYEEDVHRDLTFALALAAGFNDQAARIIASADQYVDDNPRTSPMHFSLWGDAVRARELYHFTTQYRRNELWGEFEQTNSLSALGIFLHAQQDSFSHEGYGPTWGHFWDGHSPDQTFNRPGRADVMARNTFSWLLKARSMTKGQVLFAAIDYKAILRMVEAFNRAKTSEEKKRLIGQIVAEVQIQRQIQMDVEDYVRQMHGKKPINRKKLR